MQVRECLADHFGSFPKFMLFVLAIISIIGLFLGGVFSIY
jgi:hypothetical protein